MELVSTLPDRLYEESSQKDVKRPASSADRDCRRSRSSCETDVGPPVEAESAEHAGCLG